MKTRSKRHYTKRKKQYLRKKTKRMRRRTKRKTKKRSFKGGADLTREIIEEKINKRAKLRNKGNFTEADSIKKFLERKKVKITETKGNPGKWSYRGMTGDIPKYSRAAKKPSSARGTADGSKDWGEDDEFAPCRKRAASLEPTGPAQCSGVSPLAGSLLQRLLPLWPLPSLLPPASDARTSRAARRPCPGRPGSGVFPLHLRGKIAEAPVPRGRGEHLVRRLRRRPCPRDHPRAAGSTPTPSCPGRAPPGGSS